MKRCFVFLITVSLLFPMASFAQSAPLDDQAMRKEMEKLSLRGGADDFRKHSITNRIDAAQPAERKAREAYWDIHLPHPSPGRFRSPGASGLPMKEISTAAGQAWIIATVRDYSMYALFSRKGAYTDFDLSVSQVIHNESSASLGPGSMLQVAEPGGTLNEDGRDRSYFLSEVDYPLQLSHQYLLQLIFNQEGNFWLVKGKWDVTSGYAIPDDPISMAFYERHLSIISGLPFYLAIQKTNEVFAMATNL